MRIGIPCGLLYYSYYALWKSFFENLGCEVISSDNTNKRILDLGVKLCVDEACLPVKIYHGHIQDLIGKADAVFVPRIMSIAKNEYICPKFCGLPDMVRSSIPNMPLMIETTVNLRKSRRSLMDSVISAGSVVTKDKARIIEAYKKALEMQGRFESQIKISGDFEKSISYRKVKAEVKHNKDEKKMRIGLIGHPYNIYDDYANMDIRRKLISEGYHVITPEMVDENKINTNAAIMPKRHFWTFGRKILGAGLSFIKDRNVDGIIYLSSFGCGIDSLIEDYLERHIRRDGKIPYMKIVFDEHSGEAGVNTRLEAFLDMVKWRGDYESDISSYGGSLHGGQRFS